MLEPQRGNLRLWQDYANRKFQHEQPAHLLAGQWAIVYNSKDYEIANNFYGGLTQVNQQFKIRIEDPQWVEIPNAKNAKDYIDGIKSDINPAICKMIVVILF